MDDTPYEILKEMWVQLVKMGANSPEHDMHALYLPLSEWLDNNRPKGGEGNDNHG